MRGIFHFAFGIGHKTSAIMWFHFALLLIIGAALADYDHGWQTGKEYKFDVHSRTLSDLGDVSKEYAGILMNGVLIVQATSPDLLEAVLSEPKYARVHQELPEWSVKFPKGELEYHELPISGKPFKIKLKHGLIRDMLVEKDVPIWEINILKSIVSQLQIDTQGENRIKSKSTQVPNDEQPYAMFKAMEDSVGGKCEVLYDIGPLLESNLYDHPQLVPFPDLRGDGEHFDIIKTRNYSKCEQAMGYHFSIGGGKTWSSISDDGYISRTSMTRAVISGKLKHYTIQSTLTLDKIVMSYKTFTGTVHSGINMTLEKLDKISNPLSVSDNLISTGNLVYIYNNPLSEIETHKRSPSIARNSLPASSESQSSESSSEEKHSDKDPQDSSSSSESASVANSHERNYLQSKPSLDEVPDNPLLPYSVGYNGKSIHHSNKVDAVKAAAQLIKEIPAEIDNTPLKGLSHATMEKFTILTNLIRIMDTKQIAELQEHVKVIAKEMPSNMHEEWKKHFAQNYFDVLRDALTQAGTGPAFVTLRKLIKEKKLKSAEAAHVVARLPKTVRIPTAEYIQAFFEMITLPEVTEQKLLNVTAPVAFAELIFYTHTNKANHYNRYPIYAFGRMTPKEDKAVVETYIPYMAKQLKEAVKDGDSTRIQTYIMALGNFGHPKILSVFEPYLEGKVPVSNFQRLMMVASLRKLSDVNPGLVRSVAYKIYLNVKESDDVRSVAVFLVFKTNPPLAMMQRMAAFTHIDNSKQVNSAVKTTIENLAKLEGTELKQLANKARVVKDLLKHEEYSEKYSHVILKKLAMDNLVYKIAAYFIGSDDSDFPKAEVLKMDISYGVFNLPSVDLGYMVSSIKQLEEIWDMLVTEDEKQKPSAVEKIVRALDIQPEDPQQLEGNVFMNSILSSAFYPFDNHTIERFANELTKHFIKAMEPGLFEFGNINRLMSYDITLAVPTETGLPFVYNMEAMRLLRLTGDGSLSIKPTEGFTTDMNVAGHLVFGENLQNRLGFIAPFEHHLYMAGVDEHMQLFLPFGLEVKFVPAEKNIQVTIHPKNYYRYGLDMITLAASTIPYTSAYDILELQPVLGDKGTHYAYNKKPQSTDITLMDNIHIHVSSDQLEKKHGNHDYASHYETWSTFLGERAHYWEINVMIKSLPGKININFDVVETDANSVDDKKALPHLPVMADKHPNSEKRRQQFLSEVSKDINSATSYLVDIDAFVPTLLPHRQVFTLAFSESNVDEKYRSLLYWTQILKDNDPNTMELCAAGLVRSSQDILLDPEQAIHHVPKDTLQIDVQIGPTCENGLQFILEGNQTRTDDFTEKILHSEINEECQHEMKEGNKGLLACQKVVQLANIRNYAMLSLDVKHDLAKEMINNAIQYASQNLLLDKNVEIVSPKYPDSDTIDLEVTLSPDLESADVTLHTSQMDIKLDPLDLSDTKLSSIEDEVDDLLDEADLDVSCTLDKTMTLTFDNTTYPVKLGKCWHVVMTTYSQRNPDEPNEMMPIPEDMQVAVLAREMDDGHKQVRMIMGDKEIEMQKLGDHPEVTLNGQKIKISQHKSYRVQHDDETVIELFALPDKSIRLLSKEYEVNAVYDGERLRLEVSDTYHSSVRGLCGNYDGESNTDFTTPKNCILKKPEEFVATYALTHESCEGHAVENKKKAEQSKCIYQQHYYSNIISDREAGRSSTENKHWGYHHDHPNVQKKRCTIYHTKIVEEGEEICVTTRPLPTCAKGCKPTEMKLKKYSLHCMPKGEAALQLKKRIEQGAHPDMTQRSVSKVHSYEVPLSCTAA